MQYEDVKKFAKKLVVNGDEVTYTTTLYIRDFLETPTFEGKGVPEEAMLFSDFVNWFFSMPQPIVIPNSLKEYWAQLVPDGDVLYGEEDTQPKLRFINAKPNKQNSRVTVEFLLEPANVGRWLGLHNFPPLSYAKEEQGNAPAKKDSGNKSGSFKRNLV